MSEDFRFVARNAAERICRQLRPWCSLVAVIANLVLPKDISSMAPRLKARLNIIVEAQAENDGCAEFDTAQSEGTEVAAAKLCHEGEGKRFPSCIHLIENRAYASIG